MVFDKTLQTLTTFLYIQTIIMIGTFKMEKPDKPAPNECCGGGSCCPCVWDEYFEKLKRWQDYENKSKGESKSEKHNHND